MFIHLPVIGGGKKLQGAFRLFFTSTYVAKSWPNTVLSNHIICSKIVFLIMVSFWKDQRPNRSQCRIFSKLIAVIHLSKVSNQRSKVR